MKGTLRVGFVVQGEGRGHMTQALALARFLRDAGHEVTRAWVGTSPFRSVPEYFRDGIGAPLETFDAPVQVPDRKSVGASPLATVADVVRRAPGFLRGARRLHEGTRDLDVVVNFLDIVAALSRVLHGNRTPTVAVAHNYVFLHPDTHPLPGGGWAESSVLGWSRATSARARIRLALAFGPGRPVPHERLLVVPPLLRAGLDRMTPRDDGFLLAYALNAGYGDLLADWHRGRPDVRIRCYLEGGASALRTLPEAGFTACDLSQDAFLEDLGRCRAFVGSAGFEAVCEAFHLGKPVLAVPTAGQYEQQLNAWDAERHGAAWAGGYEDLDRFWDALPTPTASSVAAFRTWVASAAEHHVKAVEWAARGEPC
jgi:uncharacterized protein (TIGR00661 family)